MAKKIGFILTIILLLFGIVLIAIYHKNYKEKTYADINSFLKKIYKYERQYIENVPIYNDYASPEKENELRKYLLNKHIEAAKKFGAPQVKNAGDITVYEKRGQLQKLNPGKDKLFYFYNVQKKYRYLTKYAARGLKIITERFQDNLKKRKIKQTSVKIAISSALRPVTYQNSLRRQNFNASYISTHSYGTSFDIFYDDYFIKIPDSEKSNSLSEKIKNKLGRKFGFILGDSLRRQLRSVLMETLLQLQEEGVIYAILEKRQRCYHITVLK